MSINAAFKANLISHLEKTQNVEPAFLLGAAIKAMHNSGDSRDRATAIAIDAFLQEWFAVGLPAATKAVGDMVGKVRPQ